MKSILYTLYGVIFAFVSIILCYGYLDIPLALFFREIQPSLFVRGFKWLTILGESQWYLVPSFFLYVALRKRCPSDALKSLFVFLSIASSGILVLLIKMIAGRYRPRLFFRYDLYGFDFFRIDSDYLSFPSGHSATALSLAVSAAILFPRFRYIFWLIGILIALSRVIVTAHYMSDILAGALIGALTVLFWRFYLLRERILS